MAQQFETMKQYQADIKRRFPVGVPWITPYEAFCQHHYNFDVIAQDYGLKREVPNAQPVEMRPSKPIVVSHRPASNDTNKGVKL